MDLANLVKQETDSTENNFMEVKIEDHPIETESVGICSKPKS